MNRHRPLMPPGSREKRPVSFTPVNRPLYLAHANEPQIASTMPSTDRDDPADIAMLDTLLDAAALARPASTRAYAAELVTIALHLEELTRRSGYRAARPDPRIIAPAVPDL